MSSCEVSMDGLQAPRLADLPKTTGLLEMLGSASGISRASNLGFERTYSVTSALIVCTFVILTVDGASVRVCCCHSSAKLRTKQQTWLLAGRLISRARRTVSVISVLTVEYAVE